MRISPIESITAIPNETTTTMLVLEIRPDVTQSTWWARICKSGSATEIKKPNTAPAMATIHNMFVLAMVAPMMFPIGPTPLSTPNKKTVKPITIRKEPRRNRISITVSMGVIERCKINTKAVIGRTEYKTSFNFSNTTRNKTFPFYKRFEVPLLFVILLYTRIE